MRSASSLHYYRSIQRHGHQFEYESLWQQRSLQQNPRFWRAHSPSETREHSALLRSVHARWSHSSASHAFPAKTVNEQSLWGAPLKWQRLSPVMTPAPPFNRTAVASTVTSPVTVIVTLPAASTVRALLLRSYSMDVPSEKVLRYTPVEVLAGGCAD